MLRVLCLFWYAVYFQTPSTGWSTCTVTSSQTMCCWTLTATSAWQTSAPVSSWCGTARYRVTSPSARRTTSRRRYSGSAAVLIVFYTVVSGMVLTHLDGEGRAAIALLSAVGGVVKHRGVHSSSEASEHNCITCGIANYNSKWHGSKIRQSACRIHIFFILCINVAFVLCFHMLAIFLIVHYCSPAHSS